MVIELQTSARASVWFQNLQPELLRDAPTG